MSSYAELQDTTVVPLANVAGGATVESAGVTLGVFPNYDKAAFVIDMDVIGASAGDPIVVQLQSRALGASTWTDVETPLIYARPAGGAMEIASSTGLLTLTTASTGGRFVLEADGVMLAASGHRQVRVQIRSTTAATTANTSLVRSASWPAVTP